MTRHIGALGGMLLTLLPTPACTDAEGAAGLANAFPSADALVRRDRAALDSMLVSEHEHRTLLWDSLPESNHLSFAYARYLNLRNTANSLEAALHKFGGEGYELVRIEYTKPSQAYGAFTLHRGTRLHVRRIRDGVAGTLPLLDVLLEHRNHWKPMNYRD